MVIPVAVKGLPVGVFFQVLLDIYQVNSSVNVYNGIYLEGVSLL